MIEVDIEEPAVSRGMLQSWVSFAISCVSHLILFLVLTVVVFSANQSGVIVLEAETVSNDSTDMFEELATDIKLDSESLAFESETEVFSDSLEPLVNDEQVDWSSAVAGSVQVDTGLPEDLGKINRETTSGGFFGIEATGNRIVYIIDMSPSMQQGVYQRRFDRAVNEVLRSVDQLKSDQQFFVYLFCQRTYEMKFAGEKTFCSPTATNKNALAKWLLSVELEGGTDPREAIVAALKMKPTCCFLLSDGEFNGRRYRTGKYGGGPRAPTAVKLASQHNRNNCPIHTIGLEDKGSQKDMTQIAKQTNGLYKFIPAGPEFDN